jgi:hypothetical protein
MIAAALLLAAPAPAGPAIDPDIQCAFAEASSLATADRGPPEAIAAQVVETCSKSGDEISRERVRDAALAMVNRRRGTDGLPADAPFRLPVRENRGIHIPDEIAPAVLPYAGCIMAREGVRVVGELDPRPPGVGRGADCSSYRKKAAEDADVILERIRFGSREERAAFIEKTLRSMDDFTHPGAPANATDERHDAPDR